MWVIQKIVSFFRSRIMRKSIFYGLAVVLLAILSSGVKATPVIGTWDFEGASGNWGDYFSGSIEDKVGANDTTRQRATKEWSGAYQGGTFARMGSWPNDGISMPTAGVSKVEGSISFAWRNLTGTFAQWADMVTLPLTKDGTNGIRWENIGGAEFTMYAGPSNGGGSWDIGWTHPTLGSMMDGNWHVFEFAWKDGEAVKVYADGVLRWQTAGIYNAADYALMSEFVIGNRTSTSTSGIQGDYDYIVLNSIPEPATVAILSIGLFGMKAFKRRG